MPDKHILMVEDSPFFASVVRRKLEEEGGFRVDCVTSYKEAKAFLDAQGKGLFAALLDLHLPDSPRGEVVDYFVRQGIPSIVFTGEFSEGVRDVVMSKNVVDYVLKEGPDSLNEILAALERLRRNREVKILVVDDSASARTLVSDLLRTHLYQVLEAEDGEQALTMLRQHADIRLMVTDFSMPGLSGVELVREVRSFRPRQRLAIVGLSAENSPLISARFIKSGANDFLRKPFLVEEFHCRIRQNMEILEYLDTIKRMAENDYLTGLPNRYHFIRRARTTHAEAVKRGYPLQAVILDLDHFKRINDQYGHNVGDQVLKNFALRLSDRFGRNGLVCRYGGEEFALLLPGVSTAQVRPGLEAFLQEVAGASVPTEKGEVAYTASAGLADTPGESLEDMLKDADTMLYQAKQSGRNQLACSVCPTPE
ncbi:diguanylate cyclase (GGDEF) domain-containing protein [Paucidesulfovibrio gracilis DSM 16080]|uniref:diguanylate cyclase n=1 Tax=Paucidesulfovibrio gracilis DSM 16080 TaxID=1121449 RepID=A0A1T4X1E7_9BACT|nr:diguanylate cyclase [Paucidesulfovibrio gracilis]SKA83376.1 diguanylate cyclase (GGDEF) domain-containing protein [Paucidesulfovibrio gracilis DSM 16080]